MLKKDVIMRTEVRTVKIYYMFPIISRIRILLKISISYSF